MNQLLSDPAALAGVLSMLLSADQVKNGELALKPFLKNPNCIPALMQQLNPASPSGNRHQAALLLKKKFMAGKVLVKFDAAQQAAMKNQMLQLMVNESEKAVSTAISGAVACLAKCVFASQNNTGTWDELLGLLGQLAQNPSEGMRTLNYSLLEQVCVWCVKL